MSVIEDGSSLDEIMLTGESIPVEKAGRCHGHAEANRDA